MKIKKRKFTKKECKALDKPVTRNSFVLSSFVAYCEKHPEQRFWQALRNWSGCNFIYVSDCADNHSNNEIKDTFYFLGRSS
jgi:hypothetical protein